MTDFLSLFLLFSSSFFAATIFPAQSELVLAGMSMSGISSKIILLVVASAGNVLGAVVNWCIGYYLHELKNKKWARSKILLIDKYKSLYQRLGVWSLLFAWLPIIGDPLTVIAGFFKVNLWLFVALVTIGKVTRYALIVWSL